MKLVFLDTETTGLNDEDRICQIAYRHQDQDTKEWYETCSLHNPGLDIKLKAMAVNHITNESVKDMPAFNGSPSYKELSELNANNEVLVAHNAEFDMGMMDKDGLVWNRDYHIDTKKVAEYLDHGEKYESKSMQYLRYWYHLDIEAQAHDALGDVHVLEQVFGCLGVDLCEHDGIGPEACVLRMVQLSNMSLSEIAAEARLIKQ